MPKERLKDLIERRHKLQEELKRVDERWKIEQERQSLRRTIEAAQKRLNALDMDEQELDAEEQDPPHMMPTITYQAYIDICRYKGIEPDDAGWKKFSDFVEPPPLPVETPIVVHPHVVTVTAPAPHESNEVKETMPRDTQKEPSYQEYLENCRFLCVEPSEDDWKRYCALERGENPWK
jgi:hypothetical protein